MNKKVLLYYGVFIIPAIVFQVACNSFPKFPVEGEFIGERISTTVDSKIASYYLENYLQGKNNNPILDKRIDELYAQQKDAIPTREELKRISKEYSVDFAALFLADRLWANQDNRKIQNHFNYFLKNKDLPLATLNGGNNSYMVLFVPGWDYVESGYLTGADFAEPRKLITKLGIENYLVEIPPHGSVEENADYLTNDLVKRGQSGINIIIVGASSAGPAIYLSLAEKLKKYQQSNIKAWVNLGGILRGSPLIDYYQKWPQSWLFNIAVWYKGWDKEKILSMSAKTSRDRFERLRGVNKNIIVINYLGL
jgi:hypothetical protein